MMKTINDTDLKMLIEATIFVSKEPISLEKILETSLSEYSINKRKVKQILLELEAEYSSKGVVLKLTSSGYRFQTNIKLNEPLSKVWEEKAPRYSRALMETLVLVAYKQPVTKAEVGAVRGVDVNPNIMKTLIERGWIKIVGTKEVPGRPNLYATTKEFLDYFNLQTLDQLPELQNASLGELNSGIEQLDIELQ